MAVLQRCESGAESHALAAHGLCLLTGDNFRFQLQTPGLGLHRLHNGLGW